MKIEWTVRDHFASKLKGLAKLVRLDRIDAAEAPSWLTGIPIEAGDAWLGYYQDIVVGQDVVIAMSRRRLLYVVGGKIEYMLKYEDIINVRFPDTKSEWDRLLVATDEQRSYELQIPFSPDGTSPATLFATFLMRAADSARSEIAETP